MPSVKIKDNSKFSKQDKNNETIMLTKIIIIFLNKYPAKCCRTINVTHKKRSSFTHVRKVTKNKYIRIFITTF